MNIDLALIAIPIATLITLLLLVASDALATFIGWLYTIAEYNVCDLFKTIQFRIGRKLMLLEYKLDAWRWRHGLVTEDALLRKWE